MTSPTSNAVRDAAGVIVTMAHRQTGEFVTLTRPGLVRKALVAALEPFDPAVWRVSAICTPRTILADLRGRKTTYVEENTSRPLLDHATRIERPQVQLQRTVEANLLGKVGALEYL